MQALPPPELQAQGCTEPPALWGVSAAPASRAPAGRRAWRDFAGVHSRPWAGCAPGAHRVLGRRPRKPRPGGADAPTALGPPAVNQHTRPPTVGGGPGGGGARRGAGSPRVSDGRASRGRSPAAGGVQRRSARRCGPRAGVAPRPVWRPGVVTGEADGRTLPLHSAPGRAEGGWALGTWQPQAGRTRTAAVSVLRPWPPRPQHGPPTRAAEGAGLPLCSHTPQCSPPRAGAACRSRSSAGRQRSRARGRHGLGHLPGAPQPHRGVRGVPCTRSPGARG